MVADQSGIKQFFFEHIQSLQDKICRALEEIDGQQIFIEDKWNREGGGGGRSRVLTNGKVFEKAGVNISEVHGVLPDTIRKSFGVEEDQFYACGLSLVIHPKSPFVPTTHCNFRMFELYDDNGNCVKRWFGGGSDLTPYYLFKEDAKHFHQSLKSTLDQHDDKYYPEFKKKCDEYFVNHHRNGEMRGIGGVFYDYINATEEDWKEVLAMHIDSSESFLPSYLPIVQRRKDMVYEERHKEWQEIRRGRYVEFNLVHDRGTLFGLKTNGRTESILMSLPPTVRWYYNHIPEPNTPEHELITHLKPIDWINYPKN